jgi:hypothetical protein
MKEPPEENSMWWPMYKERFSGPLKVLMDPPIEPITRDCVLVIPGETNAEKREWSSFWRHRITPKKTMVCAACGKSSECAQAPPLGQERWFCGRCWKFEGDKLIDEEDALWRGWENLKKPMLCTGCGGSSECAKLPSPGVRHSEVWVCKRCWTTEMRERRKHNTKRGFFRGNPDGLVPHPWPKRRRIRTLESRATKEDAWIYGLE